MSLKLQDFGGILLRLEKSIFLSIARFRPYLVAFVCIRPFVDIFFSGLNFLCVFFLILMKV